MMQQQSTNARFQELHENWRIALQAQAHGGLPENVHRGAEFLAEIWGHGNKNNCQI